MCGHTPSPLSEEGDLVEAAHVRRVGAEHLELPAHAAGVALVHLEQVAGEEVGLLAALGAADLDDDVLAVVRVLRAGAAARSSASRRSMSASASVDLRAHLLAVVAVELGEHLLGRLEVAAALAQPPGGLHDRLELAVPPRHLLVAVLVGDQLRVAEARFDIEVLPLEVAQPIQHECRLRSASRRRARRARRGAAGARPAGASPGGRRARARPAAGAHPGADRVAGIGGGRHQVEVDPDRAGDHHLGRRHGPCRRPSRRPGRAGWAGARPAAPRAARRGRCGPARRSGAPGATALAPAGSADAARRPGAGARGRCR